MRAGLAAAWGWFVASGLLQAQANPARYTDVKTLEHALSTELQLKATHVPMMGLASGLARTFTHGGVRGLKVVTYESMPANFDYAAVAQVARVHLSGSWSMMVHTRSTDSNGEDEMVWVQPAGDRVKMLVMDLEAGEMTLAQMELSPEQMVKWKEEHGG